MTTVPETTTATLEQQVADLRVVPVVVLDKVENALPLCSALSDGGLPLAEVTFRTAEAADSIRRISGEMPDILLGAGTVLTPQQVDEAAEAGASFIVTPGFNPSVVEACLERGMPIVPGVNSPSQVEQAMAYGLRLLKFFPAEASGGRAMLKALAGPYGNIRFVPTGGIGPDNLADYLALDTVAACGGSWMVAGSLVAGGRFSDVTKLTRQAMDIARSARR